MKRPDSEVLDVTRWPSVDVQALSHKSRRRFIQRATAIEQYVLGKPVSEVESATKLNRRSLYRDIERAVQAHPDGRPWGFRALIPGSRTKSYQRQKESKGYGQGLAGSFSQLLDRYPDLDRLLWRLIERRDVMLIQKGHRIYIKNLKTAHDRFRAGCRAAGVKHSDYPLNQDEQGRRGLGLALRARMLNEFREAHRASGGSYLKPASALSGRRVPAVLDPFDTVEFDAHKIDLRLKILDQDPYGEEQVVEIERVWLLAIIDIGTRAILGYTLCLRREYGRYDVIRTFEKALVPASAISTTIPGLGPIKGGGFASTALPETAYACWRQIRFDNARAHLAADSLSVACELLGCTVDVGPAYEPDDRPFIERFFGTLVTRFTHRLPGTTGSHANDILRRLKDPHRDLRLVVSLDELRELLAVWVWNYNGTPHGGLSGARTPLEAMSAAVRGRRILLRHVQPRLRGRMCLLQNVHVARIRGHIGKGEKPYVSFYHVRYTSHQLAQSPQLIGRSLRIYYDADDIRILRAYLADGTEFGELNAGGLWSATPHSLDLRRRIFRARRLRQLRFELNDDPVEVYLRYKRGNSKRSRKAASEIAQIKEGIREEHRTPQIDPIPTDDSPRLPFALGPVKARRLRIPAGFA